MNGLFGLLFDGLPVGPSQKLSTGAASRGWTLRPDRLSPTMMRFDWIHGSNQNTALGHRGDAEERNALRDDVLAAAARIATTHGFRVKSDGIGLTIAAPASSTRSNR